MDELYERIWDLESDINTKNNMIELAKELVMHSDISIELCERVMSVLNFDNKQEYKPVIRDTETKLFKVLEVI